MWKIFLFYFLIAWQRTHSNQPQVSEVFKKLPWSHGKGISQWNLAMKVLEPIPLQTAGFVQACRHLLDVFKVALRCSCSFNHPQKPADVLSRSIPFASLRVSLIVAKTITAERRAFQAGFQTVLEDERKSLVLRVVVRALYFGAFVLIYWRYS